MATGSLNAFLKDLVEGLVEELPERSTRRMFGSDAWFANRAIFALVWDGRVVVKLPEAARAAALLSLAGAARWGPMDPARPMAGWVLVPEDFHDDADALRPWLEEAHRAALSAPPKPARKTKAPTASPGAPKAAVPRTSRRPAPAPGPRRTGPAPRNAGRAQGPRRRRSG